MLKYHQLYEAVAEKQLSVQTYIPKNFNFAIFLALSLCVIRSNALFTITSFFLMLVKLLYLFCFTIYVKTYSLFMLK